MRIHVFAQHYPIPYKPYYDTQFADLVEAGHDLTVVAFGRFATTNAKVARYGLADRTRYLPVSPGTAIAHLPRVAVRSVLRPRLTWRAVRAATFPETAWAASRAHIVRALCLPAEAPDLCLVHGLGTAAMLPWLKRLFSTVPTAMYYHGGEVPTVRELPEERVRDAFAMADIVFTNTRYSRDHAVARGCSPEKLAILPVGFALDDYAPPAARTYRRNGVLRLLSAGRMSQEKGFIFALQAIKALVDRGVNNIRYSLTGEGYLRQELETYVATNGLEKYVTFLGTLSTERVIQAMGDADVLLLPSIQVGNWVENQACAVQEAMLMKSLVIASTTGGVPESMPAAMRPYSVPPQDSSAIASAIERVLTLDENTFAKLGEACRAFVMERYDIRQLNAAMLGRALHCQHVDSTSVIV